MSRQSREQACKTPLRYIKERAKGWMNVYLTTQADTLMEEVEHEGNKLWLFGFTHVLPWALHMLTECSANCTSIDATFEIVGPYVLEILHVIVRNEGMPIAQAIFPSETEISYRRLFDHVKDVAKACVFSEDILTRLRLMSDHEKALTALADNLDLDRKLCLAHLIRNAGTGVAARWTQSVTFSNTEAECRENALRVRARIGALDPEPAKRWRDKKNYFTLKSILAAVEIEFRGTVWEVDLVMDWEVPAPLPMAAWAKWLRLGCPTTTNSQESIHRWLNTLNETLANAGLCRRWERETEYLEDRFTQRNSTARVDRRTARDWVEERAKLLPVSSDKKGYFDFNEALYSADGVPVAGNGKWEYPEFDVPQVSVFDVKFVDPHDDPVPKSWEGQKKTLTLSGLCKLGITVPKDVLAELEKELKAEESAASGENPVPITVSRSHHHAAWRMIVAMHALAAPAEWEARLGWSVVISTVFQHGARYTGADVTPEMEAAGEVEVMKDLGIAVRL
jgi:hypothetical protein